MRPQRLQRRSAPGFRLPDGTVCVDQTNKTFGNPWRIGDEGVPDAATAVALYEAALRRVLDNKRGGDLNPLWDRFTSAEDARWALEELRGHDLACYCGADVACHADALLRLLDEIPPMEIHDPAEIYAGLIKATLDAPGSPFLGREARHG
jgi:uncharacterized protein DUF4326